MTTASELSYRSVHGDLYNWALASVTRGERRIYDPSWALNRDPNVYDLMLRCPIIFRPLSYLTTQVVGSDWTMDPGDDSPEADELARVVGALLRRAPRFASARKRLAMAPFYGRAYEEMRGDFASFRLAGDKAAARWWTIGQFQNVRHHRFSPWREAGADGVVRTGWKMWSIEQGDWDRLGPRERFFAKYVYEDVEQALGHGRGLAEVLYWTFYTWSLAHEKGLETLDRWAHGWVDYAADLDREGSTAEKVDDVRDRVLDRIKRMRAGHVLVHAKGDEVKILDGASAGRNLAAELRQEMADESERIVLGALRPTGGGGDAQTGARAQAEVEESATAAIVQYQRGCLDEEVTSDVVGLLLHMNAPLLRARGIYDAPRPKFRTLPGKVENPEVNGRVLQSAQAVGLPVLRREAYKKLGLTMPKAGDDVLKPPPKPDPFGGGMGGGVSGGPPPAEYGDTP